MVVVVDYPYGNCSELDKTNYLTAVLSNVISH